MESRKITFGVSISVTIFKQPKSNNWFARFYTDRTTRYTTTLKTDDEKEAETRAIDWYIKTRGKIDNGTAPAPVQPHRKSVVAPIEGPAKENSFRAAADKTLEVYKTDGHSQKPRIEHSLLFFC